MFFEMLQVKMIQKPAFCVENFKKDKEYYYEIIRRLLDPTMGIFPLELCTPLFLFTHFFVSNISTMLAKNVFKLATSEIAKKESS